MSKPPRKAPAPAHVDPETFVVPHSVEAEKATLGAAMITSAAADYITDKLSIGCYFRRVHQAIFEAIRTLREQRRGVDFLTLKTELERVGKLEDVGGPSYISQLADGVPASANVAYYADILRDLGFRVAVVGSTPYPGVAAGVVLRQSPQAGFQVAPGEPISIEVSR